MDANEVGQVIDKLAEKLGVAVEKLTPLAEEYVRQIVMTGWAYLVIAVVCLILGVISWTVVRRAFTRESEAGCRSWEDSNIACSVLGVIFGTGFTIAFVAFLGTGLMRLLAPLTTLL